MAVILDEIHIRFDESLEEFKKASLLTKASKSLQLASLSDILCRSVSGLEHMFHRILELESAGFFSGTPWEDPSKQVPTLVKGTLMSGHPHSSTEILSELRILAYAMGRPGTSDISARDARMFLEEVIVHNLEFAFDELTEESRARLTQQERRKVVSFFQFLLKNAELSGIKSKLLLEMKMVCAQRPITTTGVRSLIQTVYQKMELDEHDPLDKELQYFVNAVYFPGDLVVKYPNYSKYKEILREVDPEILESEVEQMGKYLHETGLTNPYIAMMLRYTIENRPDLVPLLLRLNRSGLFEWDKMQTFISELASFTFNEHNYRGIYGLKRMLERNLFSRRAVRAGLTNLKLINLHPQVKRRILRSVPSTSDDVSAMQYLLGGVLSILGQPIGIGQGNNATCQSARGISMWAQHSPAKLINMITTVATANNLIMRFEDRDLESMKLGKGLMENEDYSLDAVSVILVQHLDKIYNEMMRRATGRGEDPHKWANPALYGHWVPTGFASAYNYTTNSIQDFEGFVRLFYQAFHPDYNGGRQMVYPNPVGIFITTSKAVMLGFHAVSLLRLDVNNESDEGEVRAYFLNPNNEGRQDWGQGIKPSVFGNGERHGESSLPVHQFAARIYAFHHNHLNSLDHSKEVPQDEINKVYDLARDSWGKAYIWSQQKRLW